MRLDKIVFQLIHIIVILLIFHVETRVECKSSGGSSGSRSSSRRSRSVRSFRYSNGKTKGYSNWKKGGYGNSYSGGIRQYTKSKKKSLLVLGSLYASRRYMKRNKFDDDLTLFEEEDVSICYNNVTYIDDSELEVSSSAKRRRKREALNEAEYVTALRNSRLGKNVTRAVYGLFVCPTGDDDSQNFCCGSEFKEVCCGFWDDSGRVGGVVAIIVILSLIIIAAVFIVVCCLCK